MPRRVLIAVSLAAMMPLAACSSERTDADAQRGTIPVTIESATGTHVFNVEIARTPEQQARGLMFRPGIAKDGGMIFAPYPADGGPAREASFWMKDTPAALDIVFIRADGTIATIAENTVPFSETPVRSGEVVSAVLEIAGGRAAELGLAPGDRVGWAK